MGFKKRTKVSADFNMSSLTDIVFLLLIFFMLTSNVVSPSAINLMLPNSSRTSTSKSTARPMNIIIDRTKKITFNTLTVDIPSLKGLLGQAIAADGRNPEEITVILNVDENVDAQTLVSVVDVINEYGAKMILATKVTE